MYRKAIRILLIWVLLGSHTHSLPREREYIYDHFNLSNGLISDNVSKIFIDREGHAWIITYSGLQRYNGYEFTTYTSDVDKQGTLTSNYVEDLFEDRDGDLIVVMDDAIDIYDKRTDRFRNLVRDLPFGAQRRNEISRPASPVQDKTGAIWVNCNNQLVRIDSSKNDFIVYEDEYRGRFMLNGDSSALLIISDQTVKRYDFNRRVLTITNIEDIPSPVRIRRLNTLFCDSEGVCWVGTSDGLFILDEEEGSFVDPALRLFQRETIHGGFVREDITAIYEDYQEHIWVASGSTLRRIDRYSGDFEILRHDLENPNSVMDEQITGIHGNHSGIIWLTYLNEGITRINIRTQNFRSYRFRSDQKLGLGGNTVRSIFRDRSGTIWVGLYNDGLDRIEPHSGKITHYKYEPDDEGSICSNYISSLFLDGKGRLWVGSHDNGLCVADQADSGELSFFRTGFLNQNEEIYHIMGDSLGRIWIGTRNGLGMYDYSSGQFQWILEKHNVQSFLFDNYTVWISSWDYGLCRLDFDPEEFNSQYPHYDTLTSMVGRPEDDPEGGVPDGQAEAGRLRSCISIYQDQRSNIWVGTFDMGLAKAIPVPEGMTFKLYDMAAGAPGRSIYGVTGDQEGNIWISTDNGLGRFDPVTEQFENYYREDGLLSDYFMWKAYFKASDGELYFGSVDGLTLFYPSDIEGNRAIPAVLVSELRVHNRVVETGDTVNGDVILKRHISYTDHVELSYWNSQNISFSYYAAGLANHQRIRYSHMLVGVDNDWVEDSRGSRLASYNNLTRGTYYFRVRATEGGSKWDGSYTEIGLTIGPPWWKTRWAFAIYILFVLVLIFVITHSLIRFIGLKHELIYNQKLHQSKLMFFTNISHEFKAPLSLIKAPLNDILDEKGLSPRNRKNLMVARHNADNLLKLVNELLEFRRTDTGISRLRAEKIELMGFVREIVEEFECVSEQKGIQFYFDIPADHLHLWADREKFRKIINNLLENALNYTSENGLVTLSIVRNPLEYRFKPNYHTLQLNNVKKDLDYIGILVSDTGVGISGDSLPKIFDRFYQIEAERASHHIGSGIGLALVKNLVLIHQGEIRVGSERTLGTDILVMLPLGDRHLSTEEKLIQPERITGSIMVSEKKQQTAYLHRSPPVPGEGNGKLPRVLIAEDHTELRNYLMEHLSDEYEVVDAPNGKVALEIMGQSKPDLVIADWIMPVMDGEELIRQIRAIEQLSAVPVILLTGKSEMHEHQAGLESGADLVISKPFSIQLLSAQVRRIIENNRIRIRKYGRSPRENIEEVRNTHDAAFLEHLEKTVMNHLRDVSLNASVIAGELGVSRTVLYEKLKSITGQTIGEFIHRVRLQQAIRLMLYENRPLTEIHVMVGFSSTSYLIRLFRKYYHTTPGEYIRTYLKTSSN